MKAEQKIWERRFFSAEAPPPSKAFFGARGIFPPGKVERCLARRKAVQTFDESPIEQRANGGIFFFTFPELLSQNRK